MGFMLGSGCNSCCDDGGVGPCPCERGGELPNVVAVTLSGPQETKEQGPPLLALSFKSCFGSGATGTVTAPGGVPGEGNGPISSVTLTNGGSGYAKFGRIPPTLTFASTGGPSAKVEVNLTKAADACGLPYWSISSIAVTDGGEGYVDGQAISISRGPGDVQQKAATGYITTVREEPEIKASATGTGATFTVAVDKVSSDPDLWTITGVTFTGTGTGFIDGEAVTFSGDDLATVSPATATVVAEAAREGVPEVRLTDDSFSSWLLAVMTSNEDDPETWSVTGCEIAEPGYEVSVGYRVVVASLGTNTYVESSFIGTVSEVDENGGIVAVNIEDGGVYYRLSDNNELESINVTDGGEFYKKSGTIGSISISSGGKYHGPEDPTLPPIVADVKGSVSQFWPGGGGSGAEISATVNDDVSSSGFGKIVSLKLDDGGDNYLGWRWLYGKDCDYVYEDGEDQPMDRTVVCWRERTDVSSCANWEDSQNSCSFIGYQCWPSESEIEEGFGNSNCFVRLRLSSEINSAILDLEAPAGVPGRNNGPIIGVFLENLNDQFLQGWAFLDENNEVVVPEITAEVYDYLPSQGSGAEFSVSVNTDPNGEEFGRATLTLTSGGDGYLGGLAGIGAPLRVHYRGRNLPPTVDVCGSLGCRTLTAPDVVKCSDFSFEATFGEQTATVEPGGDVTEIFEGSNECCGRCYIPCPERPTQLTITFTREAAELCPEHEVEAVFDLADVENDIMCPPFRVCVGGGFTLAGSNAVLCDGEDLAHYIDAGLQPLPENTNERVVASAVVSFNQAGDVDVVNTFTRIFVPGNGLIFGPPIFEETKRYSLNDGFECSSRDDWDLTEENSAGTPQDCQPYEIDFEFS
jgi:hypothetical protein